MVDENSSNFSIRKFDISDSERVVNIWKECGLVRHWNNTELDIQRKLSFQEELFFVGELENQIIATAMFGYDGHSGWLNYFAVALDYQTKGYGKLFSFTIDKDKTVGGITVMNGRNYTTTTFMVVK